MNKLLFNFIVLSMLSIFVYSCAPSQSAIVTATLPTGTASPTMTPYPTTTPTDTPQPTQTSTITPFPPGTIRVPEDQPTIQAAIDAAPDHGLVLVAPGLYNEQVIIADKTITLASYFYNTGDTQFINNTVIDGSGGPVIMVDKSAGPETKIIGFTIQNGDDGIRARAIVQILNNHFLKNKDGVDYQDDGGLNSGNLYEDNTDDGIDLDGATEATIENNIIRNNKDEGIEIRLHPYSGPTLNIVIRDNTITGNAEDGIELIDYPDVSDRVFTIEHNVFQANKIAGLGLMDNGATHEDLRAASIPERIYLINNTFAGNPYSVSGGDNLIALNNIFFNSNMLALKKVDGNSIAAYNLFWNNTMVNQGSNIDDSTSLFADPLLDAKYQLQPGSPAIDRGATHFEWKGEIVLNLPSGDYFGTSSDLGAYESGG